MTDPRFANATDKGRTYSLPGIDAELVSVTSVCGIKAKPFLLPWAAKMAGERAVSEEATWHAIQEEEGDEAARKWISNASREYTNKKQLIGSAVHWLCENHGAHNDDILGKHQWFAEQIGGDVSRNRLNIENHYAQYVKWLKEYDVDVLMQERTVASMTHGYAGTLDMLVRMNGKTYIGDIKTGGCYPEAALQMCAYSRAEYAVEGDKTEPFDAAIEGAFVLELKPRSYKVHYLDIGERTWDAFLAALTLKKWSDTGGVIGEEWR